MTSFKMTAEGAAGIFLRYRLGGNFSKDDQLALAELFKEFWKLGFEAGHEIGTGGWNDDADQYD